MITEKIRYITPGEGIASTHLLIHLILGTPLQVPLHLAVRWHLALAKILIPITPLKGKTKEILLLRRGNPTFRWEREERRQR